jgi:hypothetical protein
MCRENYEDYSLGHRKWGLRCRAGQIPANGITLGCKRGAFPRFNV